MIVLSSGAYSEARNFISVWPIGSREAQRRIEMLTKTEDGLKLLPFEDDDREEDGTGGVDR